MQTEHIKTKSWQLLKEKSLCFTVPTCQSTHASTLLVCLFSTPSLHVSVWTDLLICSGTFLTSQKFCLFLLWNWIKSPQLFFVAPPGGFFAYGLILFAFTTCLFLILEWRKPNC